MKDTLKDALDKLKYTLLTHKKEIGLFVGVFLVGLVGFECGVINGQSIQSKPLVIEVPQKNVIADGNGSKIPSKKDMTSASVDTQKTVTPETPSENCMFVGSKNSNKYHLPKCSFAKRIKPVNRVCFASEKDAQSKGYQAGCVQ